MDSIEEPAKHTPGPWKYTPREQGLGGFISELGGAHIPIRTPFRDDAFFEGDNRSDCPEAEVVANAERIVLAVNCHDDLLDMLKAVEARISIEQQEHMDDPAPGTYCCGAIHIELLALIAKAEGI